MELIWTIFMTAFGLIPFVFVVFNHNKGMKILSKERAKHWIYILAIVLLSTRFWMFMNVIFIDKTYTALLLADLCTLAGTLVGILILFKKYSYAKILLPWIIIGGFLTVAFSSIPTSQAKWEGIFSHTLMIWMGFLGFVALGKWERNQIRKAYIFIALFIAYIVIVPGSIYFATGNEDFTIYSTGLFPATYRNYHIGTVIVSDYSFFSDLWMPYPVPTLLFYGLACAAAYALIRLANYLNK